MPEMTHEEQITLDLKAGMVFHPHSPIGEKELFSGRLKQIRDVFDVIFQEGLHAIIFGERGVGKTSLANVLADLLPSNAENRRLASVRVICNNEDSFEAIWYRVFNTMQLTRSEKKVGFASESVTTSIGTGFFFNQGDLFSPDAVRNALLQVNSIYQIIIIDEFDRVNDNTKKMFADLIKNLSDYTVSSTIILIGVGESVDDLIKEHRSVERALKQIQMPRMTNDEINGIFNTGLKKLNMTIHTDALTQITLMVQGLPYYAHLIGLGSARAAISEKSISIDINHVNKAIVNAIQGSQQSTTTDYQSAISSARKDNIFADVLLASALAARGSDFGEFAAQDVCKPLSKIKGKDCTISTFARHLNEFADKKRANILTKNGEARRYKYKFTNPLMQPFVIMQGFLDKKINIEDLKFFASV